eukprot:3023906-Rhodomonas_salina.1
MASLAKVDASSNPIRRLPMSLGHLHEVLEVMDLFECENLIDPPAQIVSAGHVQLMSYLRKVRAHPQPPCISLCVCVRAVGGHVPVSASRC